jgi:hypothetical protein
MPVALGVRVSVSGRMLSPGCGQLVRLAQPGEGPVAPPSGRQGSGGATVFVQEAAENVDPLDRARPVSDSRAGNRRVEVDAAVRPSRVVMLD